MIFIGLAGPSGAGKTTLANYLTSYFKDEFEHVRQDDYLKDPETFPMLGKYKNWEHPSNYSFDLLYKHLRKLQQGEKVFTRSFAPLDHPRHEYYLEPKPYVLVDGSLVLTSEDLQALFDKKIYLDIPAELMIKRRAQRSNHFGIDTKEYDEAVTIPEFERHGLVQKMYADHIVDGAQDLKTVVNQVKEIIMKPKST